MNDLIPVERLTKPTDLFRCEPFNATITARTCLARRGATYTGGRVNISPDKMSGASAPRLRGDRC